MNIDVKKLSPMMQRYFEIKARYPDCLLFFRLGDFYEMFFDDAELASRVLDITLTGRDCGMGKERAPMCGVPYHAVDSYIRKLIDAGYRVAICEQLTDPATSKGMLERDVVRVVTSGTLVEEDILDEKTSNYLASVYAADEEFGLAWADISTGEFTVYQYSGADWRARLSDMLYSLKPSECVCNEALSASSRDIRFFADNDIRPRCYHDYAYRFPTAERKLKEALGVSSLAGFGCDDKPLAVSAAGGLLEYLSETQKRSLAQINSVSYLYDKMFMMLDAATRRNLELTARARDGKKKGSLLWVLDNTRTAMGARALNQWLERPLQDEKQIALRLDAVETLVGDRLTREKVAEALGKVRDLERLVGRLAYGAASHSTLLGISDTLNAVPDIKKLIAGKKDALIKLVNGDLDPLENLSLLLNSALERENKKLAKGKEGEGYIVKKGFDEELDSLRDIKITAQTWLSNLESRERESTGIRNLHIGYNRVFGYYIEVSKSFLDSVPYRYTRKQTLVNAERFITEELKEIENKVLGASEEAAAIENRIFGELVGACMDEIASLQRTARALATLDVLVSFATVAVRNNYVKPVIGKKVKAIDIRDGRHPVVETILPHGAYVPNDTLLDSDENRTMIITGPNMAGKSTYMRQVALITLMAHIGSFVPAKSAEITLTDRIFTRIGASDDLTGGQSTFMVEMIEVATILNYATSSSLLVLDEIGRGTSTYDGLSIAWAVLEYITAEIRAKTLFATHFHELTDAETFGGVKNYRVLVGEAAGGIVFLHKIARGSASRSFGVEVAALAGVKKSVIESAARIMSELEKQAEERDSNRMLIASRRPGNAVQTSLFDNEASEVEKELAAIDVDNLTPIAALTILSDLKKKLKKR